MSAQPLTYAEMQAKLDDTQTLIDRARAHLATNRHLLDEAQVTVFEQGLNDRQQKLNLARRITDSRFSH
jgi:hypothetical protein